MGRDRRGAEAGAVGKCAEMLGGAERVLEMTVQYAKERIQFGRSIGSFQAIQHHAADMAADVEGCRHMTYRAAWKLAEREPADQEVAMAKAWVSDAYQPRLRARPPVPRRDRLHEGNTTCNCTPAARRRPS